MLSKLSWRSWFSRAKSTTLKLSWEETGPMLSLFFLSSLKTKFKCNASFLVEKPKLFWFSCVRENTFLNFLNSETVIAVSSYRVNWKKCDSSRVRVSSRVELISADVTDLKVPEVKGADIVVIVARYVNCGNK